MKSDKPDQIHLKTADEWRSWLSKYHDKKNGIWLIYYKKHTGKPRVAYNDAVEEALCFGWIDSIIKKIDDDTYMQKFTPRKPDSNWSALNKKRVQKMISEGKMTKAGMKLVETAKQNGKWEEKNIPQQNLELSDEILSMLKTHSKAFSYYQQLAPSHKKNYTNWVMSAKKPETKIKRSQEMIRLLEKEQTLGMK